MSRRTRARVASLSPGAVSSISSAIHIRPHVRGTRELGPDPCRSVIESLTLCTPHPHPHHALATLISKRHFHPTPSLAPAAPLPASFWRSPALHNPFNLKISQISLNNTIRRRSKSMPLQHAVHSASLTKFPRRDNVVATPAAQLARPPSQPLVTPNKTAAVSTPGKLRAETRFAYITRPLVLARRGTSCRRP